MGIIVVLVAALVTVSALLWRIVSMRDVSRTAKARVACHSPSSAQAD
jgi:hypothetical protein